MASPSLTKDRHLPNYFPVGLKLKGESVLIVGGGQEALAEISRLVDYGARVHVVAPHIISQIQELAVTHGDRINILKKQFGQEEEKQVAEKKYALVFALSNDAEQNTKVVEVATKSNILVNVIGTFANTFTPASFIVPAFRKRGRINVSVSCDGLIYPLAKTLLERIETSLGSKFDHYVLFLEFVREQLTNLELKLNGKEQTKLKQIAQRLDESPELVSAIARENFDEAMSIVEHLISETLQEENSTI